MNKGLQMKYFVLKPKGDDDYAEASRLAMETYADYITLENKELGDSLRKWAEDERTKSHINTGTH